MVSPHLSRIARSQVNSSSLHDRLTQEERLLAHARMEEDTVGNKGDASIWAGLRQAVSDPVVWLFAAMAHMHLAANGFKNFVSLLLNCLHQTTVLTLIYTVPHCRRDS